MWFDLIPECQDVLTYFFSNPVSSKELLINTRDGGSYAIVLEMQSHKIRKGPQM